MSKTIVCPLYAWSKISYNEFSFLNFTIDFLLIPILFTLFFIFLSHLKIQGNLFKTFALHVQYLSFFYKVGLLYYVFSVY